MDILIRIGIGILAIGLALFILTIVAHFLYHLVSSLKNALEEYCNDHDVSFYSFIMLFIIGLGLLALFGQEYLRDVPYIFMEWNGFVLSEVIGVSLLAFPMIYLIVKTKLHFIPILIIKALSIPISLIWFVLYIACSILGGVDEENTRRTSRDSGGTPPVYTNPGPPNRSPNPGVTLPPYVITVNNETRRTWEDPSSTPTINENGFTYNNDGNGNYSSDSSSD